MSASIHRTDRQAKAHSRTASMPVSEDSDHVIVPRNPSHKDQQRSAERGEGSAWTKEHARPSHTRPTPRGASVSQGLARVRQAARKHQQEKFTALLHHLTVDLLRDSFYRRKRHAAPGEDGVSWQAYEPGLDDRLADLHRRVHRGPDRAQPARRVSIPKADGRPRPLGLAALSDKMVQQAVVTILQQIYEEEFRGFSYGVRPGRSPHHALDALSVALTRRRVHDVLEYAIRACFDTLAHEWLINYLQPRVADPRVLRLVQQWLRAGVSEEGQWSETPVGVPQGVVISPCLGHGYRHDVFDLWVEAWSKKVAHGDVVVVRDADDGVVGSEHREDAERFLTDLHARFRQIGLEVHPDKPRLIEFGPHAIATRKPRGDDQPDTCHVLGFTHICERRQLCLRSQKSRLNWRRLKVRIHRWIPTQRILHPFPSVRFDAMHPR